MGSRKVFQLALALIGCPLLGHTAQVSVITSGSVISNVDSTKFKSLGISKTIQPTSKYSPGKFKSTNWNRKTFLSGKNIAVTSVNSLGILSSGTESLRTVITQDAVDVMTQKVLPHIASEEGLDSIEIANQTLASGDLTCYSGYSLKLEDIEVEVPIDSNDVEAAFKSGNKFDMSFHDSNHFQGTFRFTMNSNRSEAWYCYLDPIGDVNLSLTVSIDRIGADLEVSFESKESGLQIKSLNDFDLDVGSITIGNSFFNTLVDLGFSVSSFFGSSCSTIENCIADTVTDVVSNNATVQDEMLAAINDSLDTLVAASAGSLSDYGINYSIALSSLNTDSGGSLTAIWNAGLNETASADSCASGLTYSQRSGTVFGGYSVTDTLGVFVPLWLVEKALYLGARQEPICFRSSGDTGTVSYSASVVPNGMIKISSATSASNEITLSVPLQVDFLFSPSTSRYRFSGTSVSDTRSVTASVTATTSVDSSGRLVIAMTNAEISGLDGTTVTVGSDTIDLGTFVADLESKLANEINSIPALKLPTATSIGDYATISFSSGPTMLNSSLSKDVSLGVQLHLD